MKYSFVIRGFIDPRRPDTVTFNFECKKIEGPGYVVEALFSNHYPWVQQKFSGRESWICEEGNPKKIHYFSGHGPNPEYPTPTGELVNIVFNL